MSPEINYKRKKIGIPKAKIINEKNDRNDGFKNYFVKNNIIYNYENHSNSNINNNEYILNYKLSEYKGPNHYIIYSTKEKNKKIHKKKNMK